MDKAINKRLVSAYSKFIKKDTEKINVTTLCEKAGVSRASFYLYYKSMDEFIAKLREHLVLIFFEQATLILSCSNDEFNKVVKKNNLLFDEDELAILSYMISGTNYIEFAVYANDFYSTLRGKSLFSEEIWENHKDMINLFSHGYLPMLILDLTSYNDQAFKNDMQNCRALFKKLREYISAP